MSSLIDGLPFIGPLMAKGEGALPREQKKRIVKDLPEDVQAEIVVSSVEELGEARDALKDSKKIQKKMRALIEEATAPPWHQATFLRREVTSFGPRGVVRQSGGDPFVVTAGEEVDLTGFQVGDLVYLAHERNMIVAQTNSGAPRSGETSPFTRRLDDRLVLQNRDQEVIVEAGAPLRDVKLNAGDLVQWDPRTFVAYARIERSSQEGLFMTEVPEETFDDVGGLDAQVAEIKHVIELHAEHPDVVDRYHKKPIKSCLLTGVPGTGKTLVARALSNWLKELRQSSISLFIAIKPGQLLSEWFGRSESNYREVFAAARRASEEHPGVPVTLFFDEVDSTGMARGGADSRGMNVVSRVSNAFMSELDGLEARGNIFVVAATNRPDTLDPALLRPGRLGDKILEVPRPGMAAARDIFAKHLQDDIPYVNGHDGKDQDEIREAIIDAAVSRIYSPNGNGTLATLKFRDMKQSRTLVPADLVSGAVIAQVATVAKDRACLREVSSGRASGVSLEDVVEAVDQEFRTAAGIITPENCKLHVQGLSRDSDVMDVEFPVRKIAGPAIRYLNLQAA